MHRWSSFPERFKEIAAKYGWEDKVTEFMLNKDTGLGAESLDDFLKMAVTPEEVGAIVDNIEGLKNKLQQKSRVRQAWSGLNDAAASGAFTKRRRVDDADHDALLPQVELDNYQDAYYRRYHLTWLTYIAPSDGLISRIVKEIAKRELRVPDVWKTRTQEQYMKAQKRKAKLSVGVTLTHDDEDDEEPANCTLMKFLELLFTLFLAFAVAGSKRRQGAPVVEPRSSAPVKYVEVPQDIIMKVYHRAQGRSALVKAEQALQWTQSRVKGEMQMWVDKFRNSEISLGEIIQETFERREAIWQVEETLLKEYIQAKPAGEQCDQTPVRRQREESRAKSLRRQSKHGAVAGSPLTPSKHGASRWWSIEGEARSTTKELKNGKKLCSYYSRDTCTNSKNKCPNGEHMCAGLQTNGRVCRMSHPACRCTNKRVPKND